MGSPAPMPQPLVLSHSTGTALKADEIAARIPHAGRMSLLAGVRHWDAQRIECEAAGHAAGDHPLRQHGRLGMACGIEYAAQAMAVHGALLAEAGQAAHGPRPTERPRVGYLASVRGVRLAGTALSDAPGPLTIEAERLLGEGAHILYRFALHASGQELMSGRAAVVMDAEALT